ncbi:MAG: hypothetical protein NT172_09165 [Planctomycetota bacterium]|nr:hypothetical protein [Planctomycetota bacterium]
MHSKEQVENCIMGVSLIVPVLKVKSVMETINWYHEMLGFEADPFPELPPFQFAILRKGRHEIMVRATKSDYENRPEKYKWDLYIRLEATPFLELYAFLTAKNVVSRRLECMFYGMTEFEITDPDGYVICLGQFLEETDGIPMPEV